MDTFISFHRAQEIVLDHASRGPTEQVAFDAAEGRTLAEAVVSREDIPGFDNSAMDGFAVRVADFAEGSARLPVTGEVAAGAAPEGAVAEGTCMRIMTGAPVPPGADAVAPVEWTEEAGGVIQFNRAPEPGANIRRAGEDVCEGQKMIAAGVVVTPPVVGMLATLGYAEVAVRQVPRVAVVSTGDELVPVATAALKPGQIRNSNGPSLAAQVRSAGAEALPPFTAGDDRAAIRGVLEEALAAADVLVVSGGMSMGDYDYVRPVLEAMGLEMLFWKVRQRPGKPLGFGVLDETLVFGLPGNPVSSAICFEQYVRPALAKMLGRRVIRRPLHTATLAEAMNVKAGLHTLARGIAEVDGDGRLTVRSTGAQGSHVYSSMVAANCLIHFPEEAENPAAGAAVQIEWLTW